MEKSSEMRLNDLVFIHLTIFQIINTQTDNVSVYYSSLLIDCLRAASAINENGSNSLAMHTESTVRNC